MTLRLVLAALVGGCLLASGCTSTGSAGPVPSFSPNPKRSELVARAQLAPCPASSATVSSGGLPDLTLPCLGAGPAVHLAGLRGKPTVVNIWGSWCGPCQKETPYFAAAYDALRGKVRFLGVDTLDDPDSALDFAPHVHPPMRYPSVVDDNQQLLIDLHGAIAVPSTIYVSADGRVIKRLSAPYDSLSQLRSDIARYLGVNA